MPIEKDINLDKPLSEADIRQMEAEADRLEQLAKDAHEDAQKANDLLSNEDKLLADAVKKIEQIEKEAEKAEKARTKIGKTITEVNMLAEHRSALANFGGAEEFTESESRGFEGMGGRDPFTGRLKTGRTAFGTGQERSPMGTIIRLQAQLEEAEKLAEAKRKEAEAKARALAKELAEQKAILSKVQNDFSQAFQINADPVGFGIGKLKGLVVKGGIYGLIALAVIEMSEQIFQEVVKLYGSGGPYDIRKAVTDQTKEITELEHLLDRRAGRVFFTSDVELQSGPPESSNTTRLGHRVIQYQAWNVGGA